MDNHIITILQKFEKPDTTFLKDKECLICLESLDDLESNKFVQLPCKCSNSVYHIDCIVKLINSGDDKNFCPHCKTKYEIPLKIQVARNQIVPYTEINTNQLPNLAQINQEIRNVQITKFTEILIIHGLSNSVMNLINIIATRVCVDYDSSTELQVLMLIYFFKLFFNYSIFVYSKNSIQKIEDCLIYSYAFQVILFGFFIYMLNKIKNDSKTTVIIINNVLFSFADFVYRKSIENKMINTVNVV
jgi:hypothetical protein